MDEKTGYPFIEVPPWVLHLNGLLENAECALLIFFNLHRVLIFIKLMKVRHFYTITACLTFLCAGSLELAIIVIDSAYDKFLPNLIMPESSLILNQALIQY
ncbi:hypothetical protein GCK32_010544 [Trichostrongylus colubriformis]|uniref:Uncharacterized protein n=1 Tax=Trichostrongylus colubriformis TaxID=6319 RepID=A0AAN8FHK4_TRICO